jgi:hypothetical protein
MKTFETIFYTLIIVFYIIRIFICISDNKNAKKRIWNADITDPQDRYVLLDFLKIIEIEKIKDCILIIVLSIILLEYATLS